MTGHFGFSYIGLLFLLMLFIPNILWTHKKPQGYASENENKLLLLFERAGEVFTCCTVLLFSDYDPQEWSAWSWWLIAAAVLMVLYELWWIRYFLSERRLSDFYSGFLGIPLAGSTLPVIAFALLGIYGKVIWLILSAMLLGIGHIGIHMQHKREIT